MPQKWNPILTHEANLKTQLDINGEMRTVEVDLRDTLLDVLRDRLGLTGAKRGCDLGACGACTVLLDGRPVNACLMFAVDAEGHDILTIEGLSHHALHPLQRALVKHGAVQCGFCTPGMVLTAKAFLDGAVQPVSGDIREAISGNLCRCSGYQKVVDAILDAAEQMHSEVAHV